ncbi:uncharacterized protein LOC100678352 [Nasonia vitripennis]|uniref:Uncharacterized protein n=1 Tax=Nasonia vitripennis TaxID=7425 RepID=A0A7M7GD08_NASVI|nr:uncharacterized protein LOC100678352 [Nasonia vitripennis]
MSRRHRVANLKVEEKQPQLQRQEDDEDDQYEECTVISEASITKSDNDEKSPLSSRLKQILSWPTSLFNWIYSYITLELNPLFLEDKPNNSSSEETGKLLPSIISFVLGLVLYRTYEDSLDTVLTKGLKAVRGLLNLGCEGLEALVSICVVLLFWIGGIKLLSNALEKILELPKLYAYHESG